MGLSVLIPVYNYDVAALVHALHSELVSLTKDGEIILLDDGSSASFVSISQSLDNGNTIRFYANKVNEGRMAARQKLATLARFENLLFLDCDSRLTRHDFLSAYFKLIEKDIPLASGGRIYTEEPPANCSLKLHWKYGSKRERRATAFMSNNFLIKKALFRKMDATVLFAGYGHEDSWWGIQFEKAGVQPLHINNPVLHAALEEATVFITKSANALDNLLVLAGKTGKKQLARHVKIYRYYLALKRSGLSGVYLFFEKPFHRYFHTNLLSCKPRLFFFDCYRLALLIQKSKKLSAV